jgi:hypothetical protein
MAMHEFGWVEIKMNEKTINGKGSFTFIYGGKQREPVTSFNRVVGFTSTVRVPGVKGTIMESDSDTLDDDIMNMEKATITVTTPNKVYMVTNAAYTGSGEVDVTKGEVNFEAHGDDYDESSV